jgi:galactose-1-phosphate uridylyltransferase
MRKNAPSKQELMESFKEIEKNQGLYVEYSPTHQTWVVMFLNQVLEICNSRQEAKETMEGMVKAGMGISFCKILAEGTIYAGVEKK